MKHQFNEKTDSLIIEGRLWQDINGNSYHTAHITVIYISGKDTAIETMTTKIEYGYGRAYENTAIIESGITQEQLNYLYSNRPYAFISKSEYVQRKREL